MPDQVHQFGPFRLDERSRQLLRDGEPGSVTPTKAVWPETFVEEGNLNCNLSQLRAPGLDRCCAATCFA